MHTAADALFVHVQANVVMLVPPRRTPRCLEARPGGMSGFVWCHRATSAQPAGSAPQLFALSGNAVGNNVELGSGGLQQLDLKQDFKIWKPGLLAQVHC